METLAIKSETDAYALIARMKDDSTAFSDDFDFKFEGWPVLHITLKGAGFNSSLTPTVMAGFIEFQKAIYRTYALSKYNSVNVNKLTKLERDQLEIEVKVDQGSSILSIDLNGMLEKFVENVSSKLTRKDVLAIALVIAVTYAGTSSYNSYLQERKDTRIAELKSEEEIAKIEHLKFVGKEETERAKLMVDFTAQFAATNNVKTYSDVAKAELLKSFKKVEKTTIGDKTFSAEEAEELGKNARKKSHEIRLDGPYRVLIVDSTQVNEFKIKVKDLNNGAEFWAVVQDTTLEYKYKTLIQQAEWGKKPVNLTINAKEIEGNIKSATVLLAKKIIIEESE